MSSVLKDLNPEQLKAVTTTVGPLLVIAGAGTGKTAVIAHRIAHIIEKKLAKPSEILALTFTDKAAGEMEERVDILVPYGFIDTWISTFHAFGDRILRDNALDIGLTPDFKVLSRPQQVLFFQQNLFRFQLDYFRPLSNPTKFISSILSFFSRLKDENVTPEDFIKYAKNQKSKNEEEKIEQQKLQELAQAFQSYERFKEEAGFLDFGDQVVKTIKLFTQRPKILTTYQSQFKYILVDEYQDTNFAQNELVKLLASRHKNICVVGDDDQSIYKFRGAAISNIMEFKRTHPKAVQVVLTQNYRSTQAILDSAYKLIRHNDPDRLEVQNKIDKKLKSITGQGIPPQEIFADTISEEADCIAEQIEKLMTAKKRSTPYSSSETSGRVEKFSINSNNKYSYRDFAILVRANSAADHFLRALNMKGIPHKFVGSSGLYQQPEVSVLISFLVAISNFEDSLNLFSLMTSDVYEMPAVDAIKLTSYAKRKNRPLFYILKNLAETTVDELEVSEKSKAIVSKILEDLEDLIILSTKEKAGRVLHQFLEKTSYLKRLDKGGLDGEIKIQNIAKFFEKVIEFEKIAKAGTVLQFVDYLEAMREAGDNPATVEFDPDTDAVNVMTVHAAKGLEFKTVFLVNLVSDRFPTRNRNDSIDIPIDLIRESLPSGDWHMQEERRLFYVGATRAMELLYFSWSRDVGGTRAKKISPFVLESLDKAKSDAEIIKLSPIEKIQKFAPVSPKITQTVIFDVDTLNLSRLAIDDYLTCAYKYRYVHILRLPIIPHHTMVYGIAVHNAIAAYLRSKIAGNAISLAQLLEVFENNWSSDGFATIEHEEKRKVQGRISLENFWKRESKKENLPTYIEKDFRFSLPGVNIKGRYDRVDVKESKVEIIDYKTSGDIDQNKADDRAKDSNQLSIYALSYYKNYGIIPERLTLHYVESGIEGSYCPTEEDCLKIEKLLLETAYKISRDSKNNTFKANPINFGSEPACFYCSYKSICPFSKAKV